MMMPWRRRCVRLAFLLAGCCLVGCGGDDGTVAVSGDVKLANGEPLANANLQFYSSTGSVATGMTDSSGHFTVSQNAETAGLAPGEYTVVVKPPTPDDIDAPAPPPKFHRKYGGRTTTDLTATVSADAPPLEFVLDPPE